MKLKIDKDGALRRERAGAYKKQYCPRVGGDLPSCGDWCPLFGEPQQINKLQTEFRICNRVFHIDSRDGDELIDER